MIKNGLVFLLLMLPILGFPQQAPNLKIDESIAIRKSSYIISGLGGGYVSFRDFATSPLNYQGVGSYVSLSKLRKSTYREVETGIDHSIGIHTSFINDHVASSTVNRFSLFHSQLFALKKLNSKKWTYLAGGEINVLGDVRINQSLRNNGFGMEYIPTLFASAKVIKNLSRYSEIDKKFFFIKYKKKAIIRDLSYRLNIGVLNNSYRNGFVYSDQTALLNDSKTFADYKFNSFSGMRFNSALDYTVYKPNRNAIRLSYSWGALKTADDFDIFELSHHTIKISLLFNTKNQ